MSPGVDGVREGLDDRSSPRRGALLGSIGLATLLLALAVAAQAECIVGW